MNVGVVGLGLMGGSLARAMKKYAHHAVFGYDKDADTLEFAMRNGVCDEILSEQNFFDLDMLIVALNEGDAIRALHEFCPLLKDGTIVADICGVKRNIVRVMSDMQNRFPELSFVGTHPMAGREFSGIKNSAPDLFRGASALIVPVGNEPVLQTSSAGACRQNSCLYYKNGQYKVSDMQNGGISEAVREVADLYISLGVKQVRLVSCSEHDKMIAYTSQLAHIVSASYVKNPLAQKHDGFSAGSFADLTRVARLNAGMWSELFADNSDNLIAAIDDIVSRLGEFRSAIADKNIGKLCRLLEESTLMKESSDNNE